MSMKMHVLIWMILCKYVGFDIGHCTTWYEYVMLLHGDNDEWWKLTFESIL